MVFWYETFSEPSRSGLLVRFHNLASLKKLKLGLGAQKLGPQMLSNITVSQVKCVFRTSNSEILKKKTLQLIFPSSRLMSSSRILH